MSAGTANVDAASVSAANPGAVNGQAAGLLITLEGPEGAPVVALSNSLSTDMRMWEPQMAALTAKYRVLRYDVRGHGKSAVAPAP